jgi:hypothetical protein
MKKIYIVLLIIVLILAGVVIYKQNSQSALSSADFKNAAYRIDGQSVTLNDQIKYFGNEVHHDLNNDGREDIAFILTQNAGGTGTFYYVVAALNTPKGYVGSEAFFLGDRIAPQSTHIDEGVTSMGTKRENVIVVNYATRLPDEPMTAEPTVGKSIWLKLDPATMQFGEVEQNFEGEAR